MKTRSEPLALSTVDCRLSTPRPRLIALLAAALVAAACSEDPSGPDPEIPAAGAPTPGGASAPPGSDAPRPPSSTTPPEPAPRDVLAGLKKGEEQRLALCARGGQNRVTRALCGATPTKLTGLGSLQAALGLAFTSSATGRGNNGQNGNPGFVLAGHSSSLVARYTSAINPRAIVFTPRAVPDYVAMGFVRGEQFAEVAAQDPEKGGLRFFLVAFEQACNARPGGCAAGDLLTGAVEKDWTAATVYEDVDVKNTILDCTQCHQPGGASAAKILRFQELRNPWTHFFRDNTPGGQALLADFHAAHGRAEDYGPIPAAQIDGSDPANLEDLVRDAGFGAQPNEFLTSRIEQEVRQSTPGQPTTNATPGTSATWEQLYARFQSGTAIAPPYHDVKVTDATKLAAMTAAYQDLLSGKLQASKLPDIRDVFLDAGAWRMGFRARPGLDGKGLLVQMCQGCHNPSLDQTITRAKFDVTKLATMSREEKDKAIERLKLSGADPLSMPPSRFRTLSPAEIALAEAELRK